MTATVANSATATVPTLHSATTMAADVAAPFAPLAVPFLTFTWIIGGSQFSAFSMTTPTS